MSADGSIKVDVGVDDREAQKALNRLRQSIQKTEAALNKTGDKHNSIVEQLEAARHEAKQTEQQIDELKRKIQEAEAAQVASHNPAASPSLRMQGMEAEMALPGMNAELKELESVRAKQLGTMDRLKAKESEIFSTLLKQEESLKRQKEEAGGLEKRLSNPAASFSSIKEAVAATSASLNKGLKNVLRWGLGIGSAAVLARKLFSSLKEGVEAFAEQDAETKASISGLKSSLQALKMSWGAAFAPILNAVAPILQKLIGWLTQAYNALQMFFAALSGKGTYKAVKANEQLAESYGGAGDAAEKAEKQLLGFDEINKLNAESGGGGGGGGGGLDPGSMFDITPVTGKVQSFVDMIKKHLTEIELFAAGALLGIGLILTLSGANIPLGLGLIVAGAVGMAKVIHDNWDWISGSVKNALSSVAAVASGAMLGIGLLLTLSGANIPVGLGLIAAGLVTAGSVVINWDEIPAHVREELAEIAMVVGASLLAFGTILAFSGVGVGIGIGLMLAGAAALGSGIALNWNYMDGNVREALGRVLATLGAGLIAVGLILTLTGVAAPLGIGLMIAGGIGAGSAVALNWNYFTEKIKKVLEDINKEFQSAKTKLETKMGQLKDTFVQKFDAIKEKAQEIVEKVKEFFSFNWQLPHINLPHLTVQWEPAGDLGRFFGISAIPNVGIDWYARGGIVDGATLIGAGEDGKEAVVPLERHTEWIRMVADALVDRITSNNRLADFISGMPMPALVSGQVVPPRALSNSGSVFTDGDIQRLVNGLTAALSGDGGFGETTVKLYLDGRQIAENVSKHQRQMERGR